MWGVALLDLGKCVGLRRDGGPFMGDGGRCARSLRHRGESARKKRKVRQEEKEGSYAHTGSNLGVSKEEKKVLMLTQAAI